MPPLYLLLRVVKAPHPFSQNTIWRGVVAIGADLVRLRFDLFHFNLLSELVSAGSIQRYHLV